MGAKKITQRESSETTSGLSSDERLWTRDDVCTFLGVKKSTLYTMVSRKEIPFLYVNHKLRFIPEAMRAWAKKQQQIGQS